MDPNFLERRDVSEWAWGGLVSGNAAFYGKEADSGAFGAGWAKKKGRNICRKVCSRKTLEGCRLVLAYDLATNIGGVYWPGGPRTQALRG